MVVIYFALVLAVSCQKRVCVRARERENEREERDDAHISSRAGLVEIRSALVLIRSSSYFFSLHLLAIIISIALLLFRSLPLSALHAHPPHPHLPRLSLSVHSLAGGSWVVLLA